MITDQTHDPARRALKTLAAASLVAALASAVGCTPAAGGGALVGEEKTLFGATVSSHARLDAAGEVAEIGVTLPLAAVRNAPEGKTAQHAMLQLRLPEPVRQTTFFDHVVLHWMPQGLPDGERYAIPHFNAHFYGMSEAEVERVDCADPTQLAPEAMPQGWLPPVPPGADPKAFCVPGMGYHAAPISEFEKPGVPKSGPFDTVMIAGFYGGRLAFLEPLMSKRFLEKGEGFSLPVPEPTALGRATRYPARFAATFDAKAQTYRLTFSDFAPVAE